MSLPPPKGIHTVKIFALLLVVLAAGCASGRNNTDYARIPNEGGYTSPHTF